MNDKQDEKKPLRYYGKKTYTINPLLVRKKTVTEQQIPEYRFEDIENKESEKRK